MKFDGYFLVHNALWSWQNEKNTAKSNLLPDWHDIILWIWKALFGTHLYLIISKKVILLQFWYHEVSVEQIMKKRKICTNILHSKC